MLLRIWLADCLFFAQRRCADLTDTVIFCIEWPNDCVHGSWWDVYIDGNEHVYVLQRKSVGAQETVHFFFVESIVVAVAVAVVFFFFFFIEFMTMTAAHPLNILRQSMHFDGLAVFWHCRYTNCIYLRILSVIQWTNIVCILHTANWCSNHNWHRVIMWIINFQDSPNKLWRHSI